MSISRFCVAFTLAAFAVLGSACAAESGDGVSTSESDLKIQGAQYVGKIAPGETKTVYYTDPPLYRAFGFEAQGGDIVTAKVASDNSDAMVWIASSRYNVLAENDDANEHTFDAEATYVIPAGTPKRSYRLVFRDYARAESMFKVSLAVRTAEAACTYEGAARALGASFPATDGCNTCSCTESGVACTELACPACNPENEPNRSYVGTPDSCMLIRFACQPGKQMFHNACGCGCETI